MKLVLVSATRTQGGGHDAHKKSSAFDIVYRAEGGTTVRLRAGNAYRTAYTGATDGGPWVRPDDWNRPAGEVTDLDRAAARALSEVWRGHNPPAELEVDFTHTNPEEGK